MSDSFHGNQLPDARADLLDLAEDMIEGAADHPEVTLKQWTAAAITTLRDALVQKKQEFVNAGKAEEDVTTARKLANSNAKGFVATARRMLLDTLGAKPNRAWEEAGWPSGSNAAPETIDDRKKLLDKLVPWLSSHPEQEVANRQFTASQGKIIQTALSEAVHALPDKVGDRVRAAAADLAAEKALRKGMSGLAAELDSILEADAPEWYYFGLVPPAHPAPPAPPEHLAAHAVGPTTLMAGCDRSPRGQKYIFYVQIVGTDAEPVAQPAVREPQITLEDLAAAATVKISVQATNAAGKSAMSEVVEVKL